MYLMFRYLMRQGKISAEELSSMKKYFFERLKSLDEHTRLQGWLIVFSLMEPGFSKDEIEELKKYFLDLLKKLRYKNKGQKLGLFLQLPYGRWNSNFSRRDILQRIHARYAKKKLWK